MWTPCVSFPLPSLPNWSEIQEHVVLVHFNTGWAKEQFIYLLKSLPWLFLWWQITCGFHSMELLLGLCIASFVPE